GLSRVEADVRRPHGQRQEEEEEAQLKHLPKGVLRMPTVIFLESNCFRRRHFMAIYQSPC
ncbi:hypothetical protein AVEN_274277-1, partial [Araneus ventricosus]